MRVARRSCQLVRVPITCILCVVSFGDALLVDADCTLDLSPLVHPGLSEASEQDDPAVGGDPVGDAVIFAVELRAFGLQYVDVERYVSEVFGGQGVQPVVDFWFHLDGTPSHSIDAMAGGCRVEHEQPNVTPMGEPPGLRRM